jgi:uncharacterized protein (TIGR02270 family)
VSTPVAPESQTAPLAPPASGGAPAAAPAPKLTYIPEILEEHYEELQFLWAIRRSALRSPRFTLRELAKFEERIAAHLQGMLAVGEKMRDLVEPGLAESDANIAFAAAFSLSSLNLPATTQLVLDRFGAAKEGNLEGLGEALCHAAPANAFPALEWFASHGPAAVAVAALEALSWRAAKPPAVTLVRPHLGDEDPAARRTAWRILAALGAAADAKDYSAAMRDDDPAVRAEAAWAAVWACVPGILVLARRAAESADPANMELYRLLATLGTRDDGERVVSLVGNAALGSPALRFELLGAYGHPAHVDFLIGQMSSPDPETAVAAGDAFTRMLGADVSSSNRATVPPKEPTGDAETDAEFAEDVLLPDPAVAAQVWSTARERLAAAEKICGGEDVTPGASIQQLARFDLASRAAMAARNRFYGIAGPSPIDLARFPQTP